MKNNLIAIVKQYVPKTVLKFLRKSKWETIEQAIYREVILNVVLRDLNLLGGRAVNVDIKKLHLFKDNDGKNDEIILEVPERLRDGCDITSVQYIGYKHESDFDGDDPMRTVMEVNHNPYNMASVQLEVVGKKYICVKTELYFKDIVDMEIRFQIGYTTAFEGIDTNYVIDFGEICVKATEMLLYNKELEIMEELADNPLLSDAVMIKISSYIDSPKRYFEMRSDLQLFSFASQKEKLASLIDYSA